MSLFQISWNTRVNYDPMYHKRPHKRPCFNPLLLWTHLDAQSPDALDSHGRTVPICTGCTWTHFDKGKLQLCSNELALISFKQNDHTTYFDGAECEYQHGFAVE